jgi:copper chaperone CopZ
MGDRSYLHMLDGRLRIKVAEVKKSPMKVAEVKEKLQRLEGVTDVSANPTTGNVLVLFDPNRMTHGGIIDELKNLQCLVPHRFSATVGTVGTRISETVFRSMAELALERMLVALL